MNKSFLSKMMLGAALSTSLLSGSVSAVNEENVIFPKDIEKIVQKYEKENRETFLKDLIWLLPFTNPYGPNKKAKEELGRYYQQAMPRIYKDPVYSYTKRSEQLTGLADSIDDAEMKKLNDKLLLYYEIKAGEKWMEENGRTRKELCEKYGGKDSAGRTYTEIITDWRDIQAKGWSASVNEMARLNKYEMEYGSIEELNIKIKNNLKNVKNLPEEVKTAISSGDSSSLLASVKESRNNFSVASIGNSFTNFGNKLLSDSTVGRDTVWIGSTVVATLSSGVLKTVSEKIGSGVRAAVKLGKRIFSKSINAGNYKEMLKNLQERLKSKVVGQNEAIEKVINVLESHFSNVVKAKETGQKYSKGCLLIFGGTPGVGKTLVMEEIREFLNLTSAQLTMNEAIEDRGNNASSVMSRFLKPIVKDDGKNKTEEETDFARVIRYENSTFYNIDEKDKMDMLDFSIQKIDPLNSVGKRKGSSIDEFLRSFIDYDTLNGHTTNNSVVIVTTNEKTEDITKYEDSLANRYLPCFIEFKPFNAEACVKMAKRNLKNPCGDFYKKQGIDVDWDASGLKSYADKLSKESTNGRTMSQLAKSWTVIVDRFLENNPGCTNVVLSYDKNKDKVFAKRGSIYIGK